MSKRATSRQAARKGRDPEMVLAEERGADRVRAQVQAVLEEHRRVVRLGDHQIEVVEVSAVEEVLDSGLDSGADSGTGP